MSTPASRDPIVQAWYAEHSDLRPGVFVVWEARPGPETIMRFVGRARGGYARLAYPRYDNDGRPALEINAEASDVRPTGQHVRQHQPGVLHEPDLQRQGLSRFQRPWCKCGWRGSCHRTYDQALHEARKHTAREESHADTDPS